jgi:hypothetical protein
VRDLKIPSTGFFLEGHNMKKEKSRVEKVMEQLEKNPPETPFK